MSGKNLILNPGQVLFHAGDPPNGMFLVRSGELQVFLAQGTAEVNLATVPTGGMIGEMALFDQKPRSASVKALLKSEVTHITHDDFQKLMKQIPKWFTTLMSTLSGRLRNTNERLQKLETQGNRNKSRIQASIRILRTLDLFWQRDGVKDGKEWKLDLEPVKTVFVKEFCEDEELVSKIIEVLTELEIFSCPKNSFKKQTLVTPNKGNLTRLVSILCGLFLSDRPCPLPESVMEILKVFATLAVQAPYEAFSISLEGLSLEGHKLNCQNLDSWEKDVLLVDGLFSDLKATKNSGKDITLKASKKDLTELTKLYVSVNRFCKLIL